MRALVTGGGGFLGGAIIKLLLAKGVTVRNLSRGVYPDLASSGVECFSADLSDRDALDAACRGCDTVFHVAAKVGMWGSYRDFHATNVDGTTNLIDAAKHAGVTRFIFTSTPSVIYAGGDVEGWDESAPYPANFDSHYAQTKALSEQLVLAANSPHFSTVALRPHLIWGPGHDHVISRIVSQGRAGKVRRIGDFNKLIDTTYIDDASMAHWLAAEKLSPGSDCAGKSYFISQGDPRPNWDIINMILAAAGVEPATKTTPHWLAAFVATAMETIWRLGGIKGEPPLTRFVVQQLTTAHWFNISAARRDLGYVPGITIEQGMKRLEEWFNSSSPAC